MNLVRDRWMFVPVLILGLGVGIAALTVSLAVAGHPVGAEPDYYEKALHWNETKAQLAVNDRLGWTVSPELLGGAGGKAHLKLVVKDKHGVAVPADRAQVEAIPVRVAELRTTVDLDHTDAGTFEIDIPLRISGQWEFRVTIHRGDELYTDTFRRSLEFAKPAGGSSAG